MPLLSPEPAAAHALSPVMLYVGCAIGALGVMLALPRARFAAFPFGAIIAAGGLGVVMIALASAWPDHTPNFNFYIFSLIGLGGALRMISHPRPIYAALYFILTILASAGLYLILAAEFMAFALIIVYAGAILITYLFVIMLATQSPSEDQPDALSEYDRASREPVAAVVAGFILLAALTTMFNTGAMTLKADPALAAGQQRLEVMSRKVERALRQAGRLGEHESVLVNTEERAVALDAAARTINIRNNKNGEVRQTVPGEWPAGLELSNTEGVAFTLIEGLPGSIEIAGVILLMAMLGAVVLARKKVEMDEAAKAQAAARERTAPGADDLGVEGAFVPPGVGEGGQAA